MGITNMGKGVEATISTVSIFHGDGLMKVVVSVEKSISLIIRIAVMLLGHLLRNFNTALKCI